MQSPAPPTTASSATGTGTVQPVSQTPIVPTAVRSTAPLPGTVLQSYMLPHHLHNPTYQLMPVPYQTQPPARSQSDIASLPPGTVIAMQRGGSGGLSGTPVVVQGTVIGTPAMIGPPAGGKEATAATNANPAVPVTSHTSGSKSPAPTPVSPTAKDRSRSKTKQQNKRPRSPSPESRSPSPVAKQPVAKQPRVEKPTEDPELRRYVELHYTQILDVVNAIQGALRNLESEIYIMKGKFGLHGHSRSQS